MLNHDVSSQRPQKVTVWEASAPKLTWSSAPGHTSGRASGFQGTISPSENLLSPTTAWRCILKVSPSARRQLAESGIRDHFK